MFSGLRAGEIRRRAKRCIYKRRGIEGMEEKRERTRLRLLKLYDEFPGVGLEQGCRVQFWEFVCEVQLIICGQHIMWLQWGYRFQLTALGR